MRLEPGGPVLSTNRNACVGVRIDFTQARGPNGPPFRIKGRILNQHRHQKDMWQDSVTRHVASLCVYQAMSWVNAQDNCFAWCCLPTPDCALYLVQQELVLRPTAISESAT